jgi:hypothetical protein
VIYIWKLPKDLTLRLIEARSNQSKNTELQAPVEKDFDFNLEANSNVNEN